MDTPGLSFSPLGADPSKRPTDTTQNAPIQEAIRVLSMRVPRMNGSAPSVAPNALLSGQGSGGLAPGGTGGTTMGLEQLLRKLFGMPATGSFAPAQGAPGAPGGGMGGGMPPAPSLPVGGGGSAPVPHFTPINPGTPSGPLVSDPAPVDLPGSIPGWGGLPPGGFNPGGYDPTA